MKNQVFSLLLLCFSGIFGDKSIEKCKEYSELSLGRIYVSRFNEQTEIGKVPTTPGEFPHMAHIGYTSPEDESIKWICGASLISDTYVLTSAVCAHHIVSKNLTTIVRLGEYDSKSADDDENIQDFKTKLIFPHPEYKDKSTYNDIALMKLDGKVHFNKFVRPACLYTSPDIPEHEEISVTGWGATSFRGEPTGVLRKVYLDLFTSEECDKTYDNKNTTILKDGINHETMICAGGRLVPKDTCQGDSGGPLQIHNQSLNVYEVAGISSFGKRCGIVNVPSVYTRVSYYVPWIESIVWP